MRVAEYSTPPGLFNWLNNVFGFEMDVCALPENAKCLKFFTPDDDGLRQEWKGRFWMNPPFGREIGLWVKKAYESAKSGKALVVCLLPASTDTRWWHNYVQPFADVHFLCGRLRFGGRKSRAPFGSAIAIFWPKP